MRRFRKEKPKSTEEILQEREADFHATDSVYQDVISQERLTPTHKIYTLRSKEFWGRVLEKGILDYWYVFDQDFRETDFAGCTFKNCLFVHVDFADSDFRNCSFINCTGLQTSFFYADLNGAMVDEVSKEHIKDLKKALEQDAYSYRQAGILRQTIRDIEEHGQVERENDWGKYCKKAPDTEHLDAGSKGGEPERMIKDNPTLFNPRAFDPHLKRRETSNIQLDAARQQVSNQMIQKETEKKYHLEPGTYRKPTMGIKRKARVRTQDILNNYTVPLTEMLPPKK